MVSVRNIEPEASPFFPVEQGCKYRRGIEIGKAQPFNIAPLGDKRSRAAVADDTVI